MPGDRMRVFVDGDIISHRVGYGCEKKVGGEKVVEPVEVAYQRATDLLDNIMVTLGVSEFEGLYLTDSKGNFRKQVSSDYKANRVDVVRPIHLEAIEAYLLQEYGAVRAIGEEADDLLGIAQTACYEADIESVIVSVDKDLLQIPGGHYNFVKDEFTEVDEDEGLYRFYTQLLMGDMTDNVRGCPGIGEKKAEKILRSGYGDEETLYQLVFDSYSDALPDRTEKDVHQLIEINGRLVSIRKHVGEMWIPPFAIS